MEKKYTSATDTEKRKKYSLKQQIILHTRRWFVITLNSLFNYEWIFKLLGRLNGRFHFIDSVVVVYPATEDYALSYVYKKHLYKMKWKPYLAGLIWQNRKLEILFVISATEEEFTNSNNKENLRKMVNEIEKIRNLLKASHKRFAGILPGVLLSRRFIRHSPEVEVTVKAVALAIKKVEELHGYRNAPLVILGGKGFVGRKLIKKLNETENDTRKIHCVDKDNQWPSCLKNKKTIVVNISRKSVLSQYIPYFWPEMILLNEVYPEPNEKEINSLKKKNISCYHVVGIKGKAIPKFPNAYLGGIPCCAAWSSDQMEVIIRKLT